VGVSSFLDESIGKMRQASKLKLPGPSFPLSSSFRRTTARAGLLLPVRLFHRSFWLKLLEILSRKSAAFSARGSLHHKYSRDT